MQSAHALSGALEDRVDTETRGKGVPQGLGAERLPGFPFSFHDSEEIGPRMLARVAKQTGLEPGDL